VQEGVREQHWLDRLANANPRVAAEAETEVAKLGAEAVPALRAALQDRTASPQRTKAALRACSILGDVSAPLLPEVAAHLTTVDYTAEAALALSMMGRDAYTPLSDALVSQHAEVRREALRSLGKLQERAPLEPGLVVPQLLDALADRDPGVRAMAATYLGIIHEHPDDVVPALAEMLKDGDPAVRTAAATALGGFGAAAKPAVPALRRAAGDRDENVAREASRALVKLQTR
jgi:HEAT repeat protein